MSFDPLWLAEKKAAEGGVLRRRIVQNLPRSCLSMMNEQTEQSIRGPTLFRAIAVSGVGVYLLVSKMSE